MKKIGLTILLSLSGFQAHSRDEIQHPVGNGNHYMLSVKGAKIQAVQGKLLYYAYLGSEKNKSYSLQINTNFDSSTKACMGGRKSCTIWQQFVYNSSGYLIIWYWLLNYGNQCPSKWTYNSGNCYKYSKIISVPSVDPRKLGEVVLIARSSVRNDSVSFLYNGKIYTLNTDPNILNINTVWNAAEFNVVGRGNKRIFNFNRKTHMLVNLTAKLTNSRGNAKCIKFGTTAETNNLSLGQCISKSINDRTKTIQFEQFN